MHLEASLETGYCLWLMINTKLITVGCIAKVSQSSLCKVSKTLDFIYLQSHLKPVLTFKLPAHFTILNYDLNELIENTCITMTYRCPCYSWIIHFKSEKKKSFFKLCLVFTCDFFSQLFPLYRWVSHVLYFLVYIVNEFSASIYFPSGQQ